jgi:hypothetical protein
MSLAAYMILFMTQYISGLWEELKTDWLCLDCELMPWSVKAQELLRVQYAPTGTAGIHALAAAKLVLDAARTHIAGLDELADRTAARLDSLGKYRDSYRRYCWPVATLNDLKLAPFHLLASEGAVHTDKQHTYHMEMLAKLCAADSALLLATPFRLVDLNDPASYEAATQWWVEMTAGGNEGMVVKPLDFICKGKHRLVQPAVKCRGPEYLRIIYGPEYLPVNLRNYTEHAITLPVTVKPADWFTLSTPANMHASIASNGSSPVLVGLHAASSTDAGPFRITSSPALEDGSSGSGGLHVRHILGLRQS